VTLAVRSASRLSCGAPEAAVVNPGSSKITHEPRAVPVAVRRGLIGRTASVIAGPPAARSGVRATTGSLPMLPSPRSSKASMLWLSRAAVRGPLPRRLAIRD